MKKANFIVVEGLEGAGKSTALETIRKYLTANNIEFITTREPGGTEVGEQIRKIIKSDSFKEPLDARAELLLFYAARVQLIEKVIKPALCKGITVLADRFELSTFAYQGGGRQLDYEVLAQLSKFCVGELKPSLIIYLDISPEVGLQRALMRGKLDRIEQESRDFFTRVYKSYNDNIKNFKQTVIIDASKPLGVVKNEIRDCLQRYLQACK